MISDAIGLSTVHVNRTVQQARKVGDLIWNAKAVTLPNPTGLRQAIGSQPVRVSATQRRPA